MLSFPNAKINIGLNITAKRPDGFHELETVFYPVDIFDALEITDASATAMTAYGLVIPGTPDENICLRAFNLIKADFSIPDQAIQLLKQIPIGGGLGGGSADAAFLLKLLNERFQLNIAEPQLENYARQLGSDCAFFIKNKPVYATGRGDVFSPVDLSLKAFNICVVTPNLHISTQEAFAGIVPQKPEFPLRELVKLPIETWQNRVKNDFETTIFLKYPQISDIKKRLYDAGAIFAQMSGSGAAVFGIFKGDVVLKGFDNCKLYSGI